MAEKLNVDIALSGLPMRIGTIRLTEIRAILRAICETMSPAAGLILEILPKSVEAGGVALGKPGDGCGQ